MLWLLLLRLVLLGLMILRLVLLHMRLAVLLAVIALAIIALIVVGLIAAVIVIALIGTLAVVGLPLLAGVVLRVALALVIPLAVLLLEAGIENAVIVVGVLEIVFRQNAVAGRAGITSHGQKLFHQLLRVAAHTAVIAAVEVRIASAATTATARARFAAAVTAALTVIHIVVRFIIVHQKLQTLRKAIPIWNSLGEMFALRMPWRECHDSTIYFQGFP